MSCCGQNFQGDGFQGEGFFPRCPECGEYHRDLTPSFQGLVMEACAAVIPTSRRMHREFLIDDPASSWRMDPETELFTTTTRHQGRSHAHYHAVGDWSEATGAFTWAWALDEDIRPPNTKACKHAREVGQYYWMRSLSAPTLYVGETEAWHLTMVTAYLSDHPGVTALKTAHGKCFVVLERPILEN